MSITTARPTSNNKVNGAISYSTGSSAFVLLDDAPADDATWITSYQSGASVWLGTGGYPGSMAATDRIKQVKMRIRGFHNSADVGHADYVDLRLRDPVTGKTSTVATRGTYSNSAVALETGWYTTAPGGVAWSEVRFDRMLCDIAWRCRSTTPPNTTQFRLTEVYLDADIRSQPVVSGVSVTGYQTGTRPGFSFTYTDNDFDPQTRWQAMAYTSVQYGASGFVAGTSTPAWNSGIVSSDALFGSVTTDLLTNTTYKIYVRAAKDWTPAGTLWWSDWVASSAFTVSPTPPATPSITAASETTIPGYRAKVTVSLAGLNVLNADSAGFDGGTVGNWVAAGGNTTIVADSVNPKSGGFDLKLTSAGAAALEALSGTFATSVRVDPGAIVSATASFRTAVTGRTWQVGIRFYDVTGATISTPMGTATGVDTSGGYTVTGTLLNQTAPANAYSMNLRILSATSAAGEVHRMDEAGLIYGPTATWTPGGAVQTGSILVERSQRISDTVGRGPARNWVHPQLYSAGALIGNTDGFTARQAPSDSVLFWPLDRPAPESPTNTTTGMIEWAIRVGSFSYLDIGVPFGVATDGMYPYMFPAVPGLSFTGSLWLWASATVTVRVALQYTDAFNTTVGSAFLTSNQVLTTSPQKVSIAGTAPAGAVYAMMMIEDTNATTGLSVFLTQVRFRPTSSPDENWPGQVFAFTWETVRSSGRAIPQTGETSMVFYDPEAPPDRPIMYRATVLSTNANGEAVASNPSIPVHVYMDPPARTILKDPFQAENADLVNVVMSSPDSADSMLDVTEHHPSGRDGDPVLVRTWSGVDRKFRLVTTNQLEAYRLAQLLPSARSLLLQWPEGGQTYLIVNGWHQERIKKGAYWFDVTGLETRRPQP